jgi:RNAse (barnase) inhibitor barstar
MIIAVSYHFHDYEPEMVIIDTEKLSTEDKFENDLKKALESKKKYITFNGKKYENTPDYNAKVIIKTFPVTIDAFKNVSVSWDC